MRNIVPIQFTNADMLSTKLEVIAQIIEDGLSALAHFQWALYTTSGILVDNGVVVCEGADFATWDTSDTTFPYTFVASAKGLTLL